MPETIEDLKETKLILDQNNISKEKEPSAELSNGSPIDQSMNQPQEQSEVSTDTMLLATDAESAPHGELSPINQDKSASNHQNYDVPVQPEMNSYMEDFIPLTETETNGILGTFIIMEEGPSIDDSVLPPDSTQPNDPNLIIGSSHPNKQSLTRGISRISPTSRKSSKRASESHSGSPACDAAPTVSFDAASQNPSSGQTHITSVSFSFLPSGPSFIIQSNQTNEHRTRTNSISDANSKRNSFNRRISSFSTYRSVPPISPIPKPMTGMTSGSISTDDLLDPSGECHEPRLENKRISIPGFTPQTAGKANFLTLDGAQKIMDDGDYILTYHSTGPEGKPTATKNAKDVSSIKPSMVKHAKATIDSSVAKPPKAAFVLSSRRNSKRPVEVIIKQQNGANQANITKPAKEKSISFEKASKPSQNSKPKHHQTNNQMNMQIYLKSNETDPNPNSSNSISDSTQESNPALDTNPNANLNNIPCSEHDLGSTQRINQTFSMNQAELDEFMEFIDFTKPSIKRQTKKITTIAEKKLHYLDSIKNQEGPVVRKRLPPCPKVIGNLVLWKEIPHILLDVAVEKRLQIDNAEEEKRGKEERGVCVGDEGWNSHIRKPKIDPRIQLEKLSEKMKRLIMTMA